MTEDTTPELPSGRVRIPQNVVHRSFEEETVLLNLDSGQYHGLNATAGRMLAALEEDGDAAAAAQRVAEEFDVDVEVVRADLARLCGELAERGLVVIDDAA
jgi:PqqD family protein of HPr-rel-A system